MTLLTKPQLSAPVILTWLNQPDPEQLIFHLSPDFLFHSSMGVLGAASFISYFRRMWFLHPGLQWHQDAAFPEGKDGEDIYMRVRAAQSWISREIWRREHGLIKTVWHFNGNNPWSAAHEQLSSPDNPFIMAWPHQLSTDPGLN